jgi:hypothetical protein
MQKWYRICVHLICYGWPAIDLAIGIAWRLFGQMNNGLTWYTQSAILSVLQT